jgi:hypothetical protein
LWRDHNGALHYRLLGTMRDGRVSWCSQLTTPRPPVSAEKGNCKMKKVLLGGLAAVAVLVAVGAAPANADTPDQQFLNLVHSNGVEAKTTS